MSDVVYITLSPNTVMDASKDQFQTADGRWHRVTHDWSLRRVEELLRVRSSSGQLIVAVRRKEHEPDEHARMCLFFHGKRPTDPETLPPAPKVHGTSWDELSEW